MASNQDEDNLNVSENDDSIIDKLLSERNQVRVRVNTIAIIENLSITNEDLFNNLLSRLPIKDNSVVSSLTGSSGKDTRRHKGGINKSTIDKIKYLFNNCGNHDKSTDGYYVVQWTSETYEPQEDKKIKDYTPLVTAYADETVWGAVILNPVPNGKCWLIHMNKWDGGITVRLKQALLPNIIMMKIDKNNKLQKRCNKKLKMMK